MGDSLIRGCVFYQTRIPEIFISNYDISIGEDNFGDPDLTKKRLWIMFGTIDGVFSSVKLSADSLLDVNMYELIFDEFIFGLKTYRK